MMFSCRELGLLSLFFSFVTSHSVLHKRVSEPRVCDFEDTTIPPAQPPPDSLCGLRFSDPIVIATRSEYPGKLYNYDGNRAAPFVYSTSGGFTPTYPQPQYLSINLKSLKFICVLSGPTTAFPPALIPFLFLLPGFNPRSSFQIPQQCVLTVIATFVDGSLATHDCTYNPSTQIGGLYVPKIQDVLSGPSEPMAECLLPSSWNNVINVGLDAVAGVDVPTGSVGTATLVIDTIKYEGNT